MAIPAPTAASRPIQVGRQTANEADDWLRMTDPTEEDDIPQAVVDALDPEPGMLPVKR